MQIIICSFFSLFPPRQGKDDRERKKRVNECFECAISVKFEIKDIRLKSTLEEGNKREDALISASNIKRDGSTWCVI